MFADRLTLYQNSTRIFIYGFILLLLGQVFFWFKTEDRKPDVYIVPPLPSQYSVAALSFGDQEFYFRILGLQIENAGDSFGRFTALKKYDYSRLYSWFKLLDTLDSKSIYIPALAATYYSLTQNHSDTIYIVKYLDEYASRDVEKNWYWLLQATYVANFTLKDYKLALDLANRLSKVKNNDAPLWTKEMPAFIEANLGEDCAAFLFIKKTLQDIEANQHKFNADEAKLQINFMKNFIKERLDSLREKNFNPNLCR